MQTHTTPYAYQTSSIIDAHLKKQRFCHSTHTSERLWVWKTAIGYVSLINSIIPWYRLRISTWHPIQLIFLNRFFYDNIYKKMIIRSEAFTLAAIVTILVHVHRNRNTHFEARDRIQYSKSPTTTPHSSYYEEDSANITHYYLPNKHQPSDLQASSDPSSATTPDVRSSTHKQSRDGHDDNQ